MNTDGKAYLVQHDRKGCIGCTACAAVAPGFWRMCDSDGRADLIGGKTGADELMELEISADALGANMNAAEVCPVNVIHLIQIGDGKQLV